MTRFIPSEEIDQHSVRQWHFGSFRNGLSQGFVAMPEMTVDPSFLSHAENDVAVADELLVDEASGEAQHSVAEEEEVVASEPVAVGYSEEELQAHVSQARQQAYQEGKERGLLEAGQEWQHRLDDYQNNIGSDAAKNLQAVIESAQTSLQGLSQQMGNDLLQLACDIARQVVRQELRSNPQALQPVINEALDMLGAETKPALVRINPDDFAHLESHLRKAVPNPKVEWLADASVAKGGCLVESQGAQIDGSLERRWQRAVAALGLVSTWYDGEKNG